MAIRWCDHISWLLEAMHRDYEAIIYLFFHLQGYDYGGK